MKSCRAWKFLTNAVYLFLIWNHYFHWSLLSSVGSVGAWVRGWQFWRGWRASIKFWCGSKKMAWMVWVEILAWMVWVWGVLIKSNTKNSTKFIRKHPCWSLLLNKVAGWRTSNLLKKKLQHRCFLLNFCEIFENTHFLERLHRFITVLFIIFRVND